MNSYINSISLNIAFDVKWMNASNQVGGGFQYAERLISSLAQYTQNNIFALMTEGSEDALAHLVKFRNFHIRIVGATLWSFWQAIRKEKIDVIHAPIQHYSHYLKSIPMIATLHDLQHVHFPGFFSDEAISQREHGYRKVALASQKVIVSYPHVKQDVSNYYGIPSG